MEKKVERNSVKTLLICISTKYVIEYWRTNETSLQENTVYKYKKFYKFYEKTNKYKKLQQNPV